MVSEPFLKPRQVHPNLSLSHKGDPVPGEDQAGQAGPAFGGAVQDHPAVPSLPRAGIPEGLLQPALALGSG